MKKLLFVLVVLSLLFVSCDEPTGNPSTGGNQQGTEQTETPGGAQAPVEENPDEEKEAQKGDEEDSEQKPSEENPEVEKPEDDKPTENPPEVEKKKYLVSFYTSHGTIPNQIEVEENTVLTEEQLPVLVAQGYVFRGWFDEDIQIVAGEYKVVKNITLSAKWVAARKYTVSYVTEFGTTPIDPVLYVTGDIILLPAAPIYSEKIFKYWTDGIRTYIPDSEYEIADSNVKFTAVWGDKEFVQPVLFSFESDSIVDKGDLLTLSTITEGADIYYSVGTSPSYIKYTGPIEIETEGDFKAYATKTDYHNSAITSISLQVKQYGIKFNSKGHGITPEPITRLYKGDFLSDNQMPVLEDKDYIFRGWYLDSKCEELFIAQTTITKDLTLYALWTTGVDSGVLSLEDSLKLLDADKIYPCVITEDDPDLYEISQIISNSGKKLNLDLSSCKDLTVIPAYAFADCSGLISIVLPKNIVEIGEQAFANCKELTGFSIPASVEKLGKALFMGCENLASVFLPSTIKTLPEAFFCDCSSLKSVKVPVAVTSIKAETFKNCKSLTSVSLSPNCTEIGEEAFANCESLASIVLPSEIKSISSYAFAGCAALKTITIPESVTGIGAEAFEGCSDLTSIIFEDQSIWYETSSKPNFTSKNGGDMISVYNSKYNVNNFVATSFYFYKKDAYEVTYVLNGGAFDEEVLDYHVYGESTELPVPVRPYYSFEGFYDSADFTGTRITALPEDSLANDLILYAKWEPISVSITINLPEESADIDLMLNETTSGTKIIFTAKRLSGATYYWYMDGKLIQTTDISSLQLDVRDYKTANYSILLVVLQGGKYYSANATLEIVEL